MFKQLHYFKSWLLLMLCMVVGVESASAEDVTETIVLSQQGYTNAQLVSSTSGTVVTLTYTDGGTATAYYNTGTGVRVYNGGKMTVTASDNTISKIVVTFAKNNNPAISWSTEGTTDTSTTDSPATWTGSATSVDFNVSTSGHARIQSVAVTYSAASTPSAPLDHITLSGADIETVPAFYVNTPFTHDNVTVTAHYADNSTQDVTSSATFTAPDMTTAAEGKTVTVSYTEGTGEQAITKTATYSINVYEITTHTLIWMVNGEVVSYDDNVPTGQTITFPANPADVEGKTFVGWVENSIQGTTDTAPEFVTSAVMPNHSMTYYAVFADKTEAEGDVTKTYGFETASDPDWTIDGPTREEGNANTGSYAGKINTNNTYVTFNNKVKAKEFSFAFKRTSNNTNYNVYVETSTDNSTWTAAATYAMSSFQNGTYTTTTKTFDGSTEQYVRFHCSNTTATRYVDDVTIKYANSDVSYSGYCTTVETDTRSEAGISFAESTVTAEYAVPYYGQTLNNPNNVAPITWTSNNTTVATVSDAGVVTVLATGKAVIKAVFAGDDNYKPATVSYTLEVNDSRTNLTMTFDPESVSATVSETTITAPTLTIKDVNDNTVTGLPISYISNNEEVATVTDEGVVTLKGVAGDATITAQFAGNAQYFAAYKDYTIIVTDPNGPGSENNPYTVAQARAAIDANSGVTDVYATGIVSEIVTPLNTQYGNITYNISADGTTTADQLQAYRGKGVNGANFTSEDDIQVGDVVVVKGNLTKFNSTYEFAAENQLVSLTRKPTPTIKLVDEDETEVEDELNVQFDGQKGLDVSCFANDVDITNDVEITWTSADETIATYDGLFVNGLAMGTTTITFNFAGNADYRPVSKVLTVNVEDARTPVTLTFGEVPSSINVGETASYPIEEGYSVTYTSSDDNIVSVDEDGEITANAVGTATITATYDGDEMFQPATASYTITVVDPSAPVHESYYKKVTSTADITDGEYLIVYEGDNTHDAVAFDGALGVLDDAFNTIDVTINNDKIAATPQIDVATFTIDVAAGTLKSASGKYIGVSANSNGLNTADVADTYKHIFTIDDDENAVIKADFEESIMTLRYNYASNQSRFRYYKSGQQDIALYKKVEEDCIPVTITSAGAASFSSKYALDFSKVSELTAYKATSKSDSYVHLDEVEQVPAGAGVIVKGAEGLYYVPVVTGDVAELEGNLLVGTGENTFTVTSAEYGKVFKYAKRTSDGVVGFQKAKEGWTCQAGHAYLMLSEVQAREFIGIFGEDISTGINSMDNGQWTMDNDAPAYNLAGQKVGKGYKGIVVKNGKKYVK